MLRERLLKLGARVLVSARRIVVHLPASFPFLPPSDKSLWHWALRLDDTTPGLTNPIPIIPSAERPAPSRPILHSSRKIVAIRVHHYEN